MRVRASSLGWGLLLAVAACGGSGGGGNPAAVLRGDAVAPGGQLSTLALVGPRATLPTLEPVEGAHVYLFHIDRAGNPDGPVVEKTTTDSNGEFAFRLPPEDYGPGLIVQVTYDTEPAPVGPVGNDTLNTPITGDVLHIDPASEHASREIVRQLRNTPGASMEDFTEAEAASFVSLVQTVLANDLATLLKGDTESTVAEIARVLSPDLISDVLSGLDELGQDAAPSGSYHFVEYYGRFHTDADRFSGSGSFTIDGATGVVTLLGGGTALRRDVTCGPTPFTRTFTTTPTVVAPATRVGTVTKGTNGFLLFTFPGDAGQAETALGSATDSGDVIVFTVNEKVNGVGRVGTKLAVRDGLSLSITTLNGDYGFAQFRTDFPPDGTHVGTWPGISCALQLGGMQFPAPAQPPGVFGVARIDDAMVPTTFPTVSECELYTSNTQVQVPVQPVQPPPPSLPVPPTFALSGGLYAVDPTGGVTLVEGALTSTGRVSPSGSTLVLQHLTGTGSLGITLATRKGSGKTVGNISGRRFNFTQVEDVFNEPRGTMQGDARTGVVEFRSNGTLRLIGGNIGQTRLTCALSSDCNSSGIKAQSNYDTFDSEGSYVIQPDGSLTLFVIAFGPYPLVGTLSDDDNLIVLTQSRNVSGFQGIRFLAVGTRQ